MAGVRPRYLEELEKIHRRFLRDGLVVVGVALDPPEEAAVEFVLSNRSVTFTVLLDPGGRANRPALRPAPRPDRDVRDRHVAAGWCRST